MIKKIAIFAGAALLISGCSMSNPFGIGYDSSVCDNSKNFGVCGSPKAVYTYKDKIKKVQNDYLKAGLDTTLYFGVTDKGIIMVKSDREAPWEPYSMSKWRRIIDESLKKKAAEEKLIEEKERAENKKKGRVASLNYVQSDLPVTKGGDLSVEYKQQGSLLVTRTKLGKLIRDNGLIHKIFIANYIDKNNDLISSHEVYAVIREPQWVVGEATPENVRLTDYPTPISAELLKKQQRVEDYQEKVIRTYDRNSEEGRAVANTEEPVDNADENLLKSFINKK